MKPLHNHIILIGFKHVGKSTIGKNLAQALNKPFIDLDSQLELLHEKESGKKLSCRQIMEKSGQDYFRALETKALETIILNSPSVISLGGGTAITPENQMLIKHHTVIHITAPRGIVYERIMMSGRPAFFDLNEDLLNAFNTLFNEREKVHESIRHLSINNNHSIEHAVSTIMGELA